MGARVISNPIKKIKRLVVEKVINRAIKIISTSVVKVSLSPLGFFLRCPILAIRETGISHSLRIRRGVLR